MRPQSHISCKLQGTTFMVTCAHTHIRLHATSLAAALCLSLTPVPSAEINTTMPYRARRHRTFTHTNTKKRTRCEQKTHFPSEQFKVPIAGARRGATGPGVDDSNCVVGRCRRRLQSRRAHLLPFARVLIEFIMRCSAGAGRGGEGRVVVPITCMHSHAQSSDKGVFFVSVLSLQCMSYSVMIIR